MAEKPAIPLQRGGCLILLSQDASGNQYISVVLKAQDKNMIYVEMSEVLDEIAK